MDVITWREKHWQREAELYASRCQLLERENRSLKEARFLAQKLSIRLQEIETRGPMIEEAGIQSHVAGLVSRILTKEAEATHDEIHIIRLQMAELDTELQAADQRIREQNAEITKLRAYRKSKKVRPSPMSGANILGAVVHVRFACMRRLTREEIFHRIEAEAAGFNTRDPEMQFDLRTAMENWPDIEWTPPLGRNQQKLKGAKLRSIGIPGNGNKSNPQKVQSADQRPD